MLCGKREPDSVNVNRMTFLTKYIITACFLLFTIHLRAQTNLVPNGSFETYSTCPTQLSNTSQQLMLATGWVVPSAGTPDYFNTCALPTNNVSVPQNTYGYQTPRSGNAYAGFYAFTNPIVPTDNIREYLQIGLAQPLIAGKTYYFKMYVNLANSILFRKAASNIGAYFSVAAITKPDNGPFTVTPHIQSSNFLTDTVNWTEISGSYVSTGGERFLTIGRFGNENTVTTKPLNGDVTPNSAYYYIDDVSLIDSCYQFNALNSILGSDAAYNCIEKPMNITLNVQNAITTNYVWSTAESTPSINVTSPGTYWVKMSTGKCFAIDTLKMLAKTQPVFSLGNDTAPCFNSTLTLKPHIASDSNLAYTYRWTKRVGNNTFELGNNTQYIINYPDEIMLELSSNGCKRQDTIVIYPSALKQVKLPSDTTICRNTSLTLNAQTQGALSYLWSSGETTPIIKTHNQQTYWVKAKDGFCESVDTVQYTIIGAANFLKDSILCGDRNLELKGDPLSTSYLWNTGAQTESLPVNQSGTYILTQLKDGCLVSDTAHITIDPIPYSYLGSDTSICVNPVYEIKANSPLAQTYKWNTGDTTSSIIIQNSGKYVLTTFYKNCSYRDSILIQTQTNIPFSFGEDQSDCFSEPIILNPKAKGNDKLLWSDGSTGKSLKITQAGTYWLRVTSGFCINYDTITFHPKPLPTVNLGSDTVLCIGNKLILDAQDGAETYIWNTGADSRIIEVTKTGYYFVEKRTADGCYAVDTIDVKFIKGFELFKNNHWKVCQDSSTEIVPKQGLATYLWSDQSTLPTLTINTPGSYWLEATDANGCMVNDTVTVDQYDLPEIVLDSLILTCDFPFTIQPEGKYQSYLWTGDTKEPTKEITGFGITWLTVTDTVGCMAKASVEVKNNCPPGVTMTNVFTPNGDGLNDIIMPQYQHIKSTKYVIINRWGSIVYETSDIYAGWDGSLPEGQEAPAGVYYFTVECVGKLGDNFSLQGSITLIR